MRTAKDGRPLDVVPEHETQMQVMRCTRCRTRFRWRTPVRCDVRVWGAALAAIRCPWCLKGPKGISMSEGRTLGEDLRERRAGNEDERAAHWLATGETGQSSEAIHRVMTGRQMPGTAPHHPSDADDVRRCVLLLGHVPEWRERLAEMGRTLTPSPEWEALARDWEAIEGCMLQESPNLDGAMPKAAAMVARALAVGRGVREARAREGDGVAGQAT